MGHDQNAATAMMHLRAAAHALAELDLPPAEVLRRLDRITVALGVVALATCLYAIIDPGHRSGLIAGAGHLPPVLVHPDGTTRVPELPSGLPLGLGTAIYGQISLPLPPGAALALYTDGLVDTRTRSSQQGIEALRAELAGLPGPASANASRPADAAGPLQGCCDRLVGALAPQPEDDTTLVLARVRSRPVAAPPPVPL
jgi:serine phosphatase RsbU (regulator of sigma subunit)